MKKVIAGLLAGVLVASLPVAAEAAKKKKSASPPKIDRAKAWELCQQKYGYRIQRIMLLKNGKIRCYIYE